MLLKVAFAGAGWLVQIGNVVQMLYLFLIIVQVRRGGSPACAARARQAGARRRLGLAAAPAAGGPPPADMRASIDPPLATVVSHATSLAPLAQLIINLKNKPEAVEKVHSFCAIYFCLYMLVFTGVSIRCASLLALLLLLLRGRGGGGAGAGSRCVAVDAALAGWQQEESGSGGMLAAPAPHMHADPWPSPPLPPCPLPAASWSPTPITPSLESLQTDWAWYAPAACLAVGAQLCVRATTAGACPTCCPHGLPVSLRWCPSRTRPPVPTSPRSGGCLPHVCHRRHPADRAAARRGAVHPGRRLPVLGHAAGVLQHAAGGQAGAGRQGLRGQSAAVGRRGGAEQRRGRVCCAPCQGDSTGKTLAGSLPSPSARLNPSPALPCVCATDVCLLQCRRHLLGHQEPGHQARRP